MERQFKQNRNLRCGYTTGSCAAAAAKAGTWMLLSGETIGEICINTPKGTVLVLSVSDINISENQVTCAIRKDSGDDPDVTNGILIFATVTKACQSGIHIHGGDGVGIVTKPGLSCSIGEPAINPVPRQMIIDEVSKVCFSFGFSDGIDIMISVPEGEKIAQKTFNPRLGIQGGISIIGTTGIVEPMSEIALIETIRLEMNQHKESGIKNLVVCPGNYGEAFLRNTLDIKAPLVMCSNYFGEMLDFALEIGFESILLVGHAGKLIKLAAGIMNTHSKNADCRLELLALHGALCGADNEIVREIMGCITTDEGIKVLNRINVRDAVFESIMIKIDYYLQHRVYRRLKTDVVIFSNEYGILGKTENANKMIETLYGVGIGPGDWELMTLKAVRIIDEADIIAFPKTDEKEMTALNIVRQAMDLTKKELMEVYMPMSRDRKKLQQSHDLAAGDMINLLKQGKVIAFLTLGDPSIYSTYSYIHQRVLKAGFTAQIIPGVPSFCAVSAKLNISLCEGGEPLHIIPASYKGASDYLDWKGTKVLMKSGKEFKSILSELERRDLVSMAAMVECCGMEKEKVFKNLKEAYEKASYFSVVVVKDKEKDI